MAANTFKHKNNKEISLKNERSLMNKLRDSGLEYIATCGKVVAAKKQAEFFCHCPQKCKDKLPQGEWEKLFQQFYELADQLIQNEFLQNHILIKAVHLHNMDADSSLPPSKRRVTCKYHVPDLRDETNLEDHIERNEKTSIEVCQKAYMNCYGITEKRVRMQRERCICKLAPDHYRNSTITKKYSKAGTQHVVIRPDSSDTEGLSNESDSSPLNLSTKSKGIKNQSTNDGEIVEPLDLSPEKQKPLDIDPEKLYDLAKKIGVSRERIQREMAQKYEQLIKQNLRKQQDGKKRKSISAESEGTDSEGGIENRQPTLKAISEQVVGLNDDFTILPIQTLNNGDLTITPVLGEFSKPVQNQDIMQVNYFFQNQLWKPEYLGIGNGKKIKVDAGIEI